MCVCAAVCVYQHCLCGSSLLFCLLSTFLANIFFRLELVRTHIVDAYSRKRGHGHGGLPCDFFLDALSYSAFTFDFAQRVALACDNFYLWLCKHHLFNVLATFSSKSTFAALMVLGHFTTIYA